MEMDYSKLPVGLLPESLPNAMKINKILEESYKIQKKIGLSNACGFVSIILQKGLEAVGIESEVKFGCLKSPGTRLPHLWLLIEGRIVDNTYCDSLHKLGENRQLREYEDIIPSEDTEDLFLSDEDTVKMGLPAKQSCLEGSKWQTENKNRFITISQNKVSIREYVQQFAAFLQRKYSVEVFPATYANDMCWECDNVGSVLSCSACKVAKYCNKKCQRKDWKRVHKNLCIPPDTM